MAFTDTLITIIVLILFFLLIYMGMRKASIGETIVDIKNAFSDRASELKDASQRYA